MAETAFKFTKERLTALPSPAAGSRTTYRDIEVSGLELRVTSNGTKTFCWFRRVKNGQPERITIGRFPDVTVIQARAEATKLNAVRVAGESPVKERRQRQQEALTFGDFFDVYMERHAKVHKKTWSDDQQRFDQYLSAPLGRVRLAAVTREMVSKIHAQITASGHPAVANRVLALASGIFGCAVEWSLVSANPVTGIRRNREVSRDRFLRSDELPRFFNALLQEPNEILRDLFLVLLFTGARRANVLSMAWSDINLEAGTWRIPDTKTGEPHNVPLTAETIEILNRRRATGADSRFVFPGPGASGHVMEPKKAWTRLFDRDELAQLENRLNATRPQPTGTSEAEPTEATEARLSARLQAARAEADKLKMDRSDCRMPATRIHDLRRTQGSWQAMTGSSLQVIGKGLGHKNVATTAIYARLQTDPVREAMSKATGAMLRGVDLTGLR